MKQLLATFLVAFLGCGTAVVGLWSGDRSPPTETISSRIEPAVVPAGGGGEVQYVYLRYRACDRRIRASIIDAAGRQFEFLPQTSPPTTGRLPGRTNSYARPFRVSSAAQPGPAVYHVEIEDICNPLQTVWPIRRTVEVPFEIGPVVPVAGALGYRADEGMAQCIMRRFAGLGR
ncbi:hypothetical protein [Aureimonas sp. ME7]|uniref:hypothetical protein n=1 Tax=Aureimonas sp. ME7 TaxID=2744252 RepID=UPI0015FCE957|nr:hypothetical protein [Aureimonas sp. ME7]